MKEIIRVYTLKEDLTLQEELMYVDRLSDSINPYTHPSIATGRKFSVQDLEEKLLMPSLGFKIGKNSPKVINGAMDINSNGDTCYCFEFNKNCNIQKDEQSVVTKALMVKIPSEINEYILSTKIDGLIYLDFEEQIESYEHFINTLQAVRKNCDKKKYRLQKRNQLVSKSMTVALAIGAAGVIGVAVKNGIPKFMEYLNENQQIQRELEQQDYRNNPSQTISELQQQRILSEQNPELKQYFDGILEEHQNDRKHL